MPKQKARQGGLPLVSDLSTESFGAFLQKLARKPKSGVEGVADLTRQQLTRVCVALEQHIRTTIYSASGGPDGSEAEAEPPANLEDVLMTLYGASLLALDLLTQGQQPPPEELLAAAVMLHDEVLMGPMESSLGNIQLDLQDAIMRLCCTWWERKLPGNEMLVSRTIPYVLLRSVEHMDRGKASLVHMCYVIREALELLDFEDETIKDTKKLLLLAAMHPTFLRELDGRRFIAGLFKLEPQLTRELMAVVQHQIPAGQRFALDAYGDILFRAWRDTVGPCAAEVEAAVQSLMSACIYASTPQLAASLRTVLDGFHKHKNLERRLNPALVRLYDPILPRAFASANAEVRCNAVNLLVAAFPIMDPDAPAAENNTRLTRQMGLLVESLSDPCPDVRQVAVTGCCNCLKYFWAIIPAATSAKIIQDITSKLAFDASSRHVRATVLRGLCALLDCQHALPVLKKALPNVSPLLYDTDPAVREALADLLVAVSSCRELQLAAILPLGQLLEAMAEESAPAVARKISRILVPSYFPNAQEGPARLGSLLRSNPEAGLAFCHHMVARFLPDSDPQGAGKKVRSAAEFTASVPTEHILQLAGDLASHLLATASGLHPTALAARDGQSPPAKRPKARRGGKGASGATAAGKKRAKKQGAEEDKDEEERQAAGQQAEDAGADNANAGANAQPADDVEEDVLLQNPVAETEEAWLAMLEGLVVVVQGLSAAVVGEELDWKHVDAALPAEALLQLLQTAEEHLRKPRAVKRVLQMATALYFIPGAQKIRDLLFGRLVEGTLPGLGGGASEEVMELDGHRGPSGVDVELLAEILRVLATGNNGPKLAAILSAALGTREPLPVRKPVDKKKKKTASKATSKRGVAEADDEDEQEAAFHLAGLDLAGHRLDHEAEGEDDIICQGCRRAKPEGTMLICDGCETACHIHCMKPALSEVPETDWFCWRCETQLQAVKLPAAAAARCIGVLLQLDAGRELLCQHPDFSGMLQAMHELAMQEAEEIVRVVQTGASGRDGEEADSAPVHPETPETAKDLAFLLLGDPWGTLARYCRAALHRALSAALPRGEDEDAGGAATASRGGLTPGQRTPGVAGRRHRGRRSSAAAAEEAPAEDPGLAGFYEIVPVIDWAVQTCVQLAQMVMEEPCLAAQLAALRYSQGLLRVLYLVHQIDLLSLNAEYVAQVSLLCTVQAALAQAAVNGLAAEGGGSQHQQAVVAETIQIVLGLTQQMVAAVRTGAAGGDMEAAALGGRRLGGSNIGPTLGPVTPAPARAAPGVRAFRGLRSTGAGGSTGGKDAGEPRKGHSLQATEDPEELLSQQLEERMDAAAGACGGNDTLAVPVQEGRAAGEGDEPEAPPVGVSAERLAVAMMNLLCDPAVAGLLKGEVRISAADLVGELLSATRRAQAGGWLDALSRLTGETLVSTPATSQLEAILREQHSADGDDEGKGPHEHADVGPAEPEDEDAAGGAVRGVRRRPRAGGVAAGRKAAAAASGSAKAQLITATRLSELLKQENPAVATMANVLVRVCTARKAHGHAMLLLAHLAVRVAVPEGPATLKSTADNSDAEALTEERSAGANTEPDEDASALGAAVLIALCQAAVPAVDASVVAASKQVQPAADRRRTGARCGRLAQEAKAQGARAETEAVAKALGVLQRLLEKGRVLQPLQPGQPQHEHAQDAVGVRGLVRSVVQTLMCNGV